MKDQTLVGKEAYSKEGNILGKIIRVEGNPEANIIAERPQAVIEVERFLVKPDLIPIHLTTVIAVEEEVFFDIPIKEFRKLQKIYRYERKKFVKAAKDKTKAKDDLNKGVIRTLAWMRQY